MTLARCSKSMSETSKRSLEGRTSPPSRHVREILMGGRIGCPRCGAVEWRALR